MKACVHTRYGPPEVVRLQELPTPQPAANEVLVQVHASTVNRTDSGFRSAEYFISRLFSGLFKPKQTILGCEFAGQVVQVGAAVTRYQVDERVFGFNDEKFGGHAEYMLRTENDTMAVLPAALSYAQGAALTEGAHYALFYIRACKLQAGQRVLINGATGAIGSAAVQLMRHFGAEITATCATPHIEMVRALGAQTVIDYTQQDFTELGQQFDVVFDAVGKSTFGRCKRLLKPKGNYMSTELGPGGQNPFLALITPLLGGRQVLFPIPSTRQEDIELLRDLAEQGKYMPVIDRSYAMQDIVAAYRYVESGQKIGNVILEIVQP